MIEIIIQQQASNNQLKENLKSMSYYPITIIYSLVSNLFNIDVIANVFFLFLNRKHGIQFNRFEVFFLFRNNRLWVCLHLMRRVNDKNGEQYYSIENFSENIEKLRLVFVASAVLACAPFMC